MMTTATIPLSDSTSTTSSRPRVGGATVRKAKLQDAVNIFELVNSLAGDGTLLRRNYAEICENVRDFAVAESPRSAEGGGVFLGCGALHLYGPHLAEVRSIVVKPEAKGQGAGGKILRALLEEAEVEEEVRDAREEAHAGDTLLFSLVEQCAKNFAACTLALGFRLDDDGAHLGEVRAVEVQRTAAEEDAAALRTSRRFSHGEVTYVLADFSVVAA